MNKNDIRERSGCEHQQWDGPAEINATFFPKDERFTSDTSSFMQKHYTRSLFLCRKYRREVQDIFFENAHNLWSRDFPYLFYYQHHVGMIHL